MSHLEGSLQGKSLLNRKLAHRLETRLTNSKVGDWTIAELLGFGKSAAVFRAQCGEQESALKVFDPEIVDLYGEITQLSRIRREVSLSNHKHNNLVNIYEGGKCQRTGHLYLAMERIDAQSLDSLLKNIPRPDVRRIIREVSQAARFLETIGLAHRDIKPSNIIVAPDRTVLLDLGVLRMIASPGGTDYDDTKRFLGTLQYSPPEFLLREEEDSIEGWRAVTFYQLGAVLHDLIEQKPIFSGSLEPYARLVNAVQRDTPSFTASDVPPDLISLAQNCLSKNPSVRLELVSWEDFERAPTQSNLIETTRERLRNRQGLREGEATRPDSQHELSQVLHSKSEEVSDIVRSVCVSEESLPPFSTHELRIRDFKSCFTLSFAPSTSFGLKVFLHIEFVTLLVDAASMSVCIDATAWIEAEQSHPTEDQSDHQRIFAGRIDRDLVEGAVLSFVLPAFERALVIQEVASQREGQIRIQSTAEGQENE